MSSSIENKIRIGLAILFLVLLGNGLASYRATRTLIENQELVAHTYQVINEVESILSTVKDAETGERGYLITGDEAFLEPYNDARAQIDRRVGHFEILTADNPTQHARIPALRQQISSRMALLEKGISLRKAGDVAGANQFTLEGPGVSAMENLRHTAATMEAEESRLLQHRAEESRLSAAAANLTFVIGNIISLGLLLAVGYIIHRDLGARVRVEEELRTQRELLQTTLTSESEALERAEAANRAKDEFLATLSHELRTPLTAIYGWVNIMKNTPFDAHQWSKALDVIDRNVKAQTQLVDDLLSVSRIITGNLKMDLTLTDPLPVTRTAIDSIRPAADAKSIKVETKLDENVGQIYMDADRWQQVLWNLLSNAVKFTPQGGKIKIEFGRNGHFAQLSVTDTGEGIEAEFLPKVFDRFRQADSSSTRRHGGLGLGLAIVRHIVELHGGNVMVRSDGRAKGSTFIVQLPLPNPSATSDLARDLSARVPPA